MATYHFSIKSGKRGKATEHANYIAREGKHGNKEKKDDLIAKDHGNLPAWAGDDPAQFWKAADKNERANGAAYREFELALPSELTIEQNLELVQEFVQQELGNKPYQLAIHAPDAALGSVKQIHGHVMCSDRKPDGIDRSPEQHFKRFNAKNPEKGGCKKDSGGKERGELRDALISTRENWAALQNRYLEKYGHDARVDHRSHRERGIDKEPEKHLGQAAIQRMSSDEKKSYREKRKKAEKT